MTFLRKTAVGGLLLFLWALPVVAQRSVEYEVAFPNALHHEAEVTVTFRGAEAALQVRMSRTSPGRYALHEFAKNVYDVRVADGAGGTPVVTQPNLHQWDVAGHDGTVRLTYTLFGDRADGTYTGIDGTHAHLNMPATFMWARGMEEAPIRITFHRPDTTWRIATQLLPTDDPEVFTAPDMAYFMDSPTEISPFSMRTWTIESNGKTYTYRVAVHHDGTEAEVDEYAEKTRWITLEEVAVFGETPDYEPGTYTFIADYLPYVDGDGMEHRNATILTSTRPLSTGMLRNLGTVAHEFFHQWNVERIRPVGLEPFDFERASVSKALWLAEGFTSYYTGLMLRRAGLTDDAAYAEDLSGTVSTVVNAPGRRFYSAVEMSMQAPFVDAAVSIDPQNKRNTFISYYTWGSAIGLGLDLTLRTRFGRTLDDFMRALWQAHGKPERPYTLEDVKRVLTGVTGDAAFVRDFFGRYVEGHEVVDYEALLAPAGFLLCKAHPGRPWLGAPVEDTEEGVVVMEGPLIGSPLYEAGVDRGDVLLEVDGLEIKHAGYVEALLAVRHPGEALPLRFRQRSVVREATLTLTEDPALEVVPYESVGRPVTDAIRAFRDAWLGSRTAE